MVHELFILLQSEIPEKVQQASLRVGCLAMPPLMSLLIARDQDNCSRMEGSGCICYYLLESTSTQLIQDLLPYGATSWSNPTTGAMNDVLRIWDSLTRRENTPKEQFRVAEVKFQRLTMEEQHCTAYSFSRSGTVPQYFKLTQNSA